MKDLDEFMKAVEGSMKELFGNCQEDDLILRSVAEHMGVVDSTVIVEAVLESGLNPEEAPYPVLHFHSTLAQNIEEDNLRDILYSVSELNDVINVGGFPAFGCFSYFPPLRQIYLSYRMPVNMQALDAELINVRYYLGTLYEQLDIFTDFIIFICDIPGRLTIKDYMEYLDIVSDIADMEEKTKELEKLINERLAAKEDDGQNT